MYSNHYYADHDISEIFYDHVKRTGNQCHFCTFVLFGDAYDAMFEWDDFLMSRGYHSVTPL